MESLPTTSLAGHSKVPFTNGEVNAASDKAIEAQTSKSNTGKEVSRYFTKAGQDPSTGIQWEKRDCIINSHSGEIIFEQKQIEVPSFWSQMATTVVASKYLYGELGSTKRETSINQLVKRVANQITSWGTKEKYFLDDTDFESFNAELTHIILHQYASFNSPVWFNVGIQEKPQCSACFILSVDDTMDSLLELQTIEGKLFKYGSGTGTNLSNIRSSKEKLAGGGVPSGPVSFMRAFDAWAGIIKSGGKTRRAAKMQILNVTHPDILEFIECKSQEEKKAWALIEEGYDPSFYSPQGAYQSVALQNANLSVRVSDEFMCALEADDFFWTIGVSDGQPKEKLNAKDILRCIAEATWTCGDPGIQFDTTINKWHTCPESGRINASNPCSEYMHLDNSACNLASINLLKFIDQEGNFDAQAFLHVVDTLITAQDILIDRSSYPTTKIADCAREYRQLGLGYANLGALLMQLGLPYDSDEARAWAGLITALMSGQAYKSSALLAKARGAFAGYQANKSAMLKVIDAHRQALKKLPAVYIEPKIYKLALDVWDDTYNLGVQYGFRNSQTTVIAPTGTISFMMDCTTTGIEPDISLVKYKKLSSGGFLKIVNEVLPQALLKLGYSENERKKITDYVYTNGTIEGAPELKPEHLSVFDCAMQPQKGKRFIHYLGHLKMMAAVQPFISGAISKTVNLPTSASIDEIFNIYLQAWHMGLKAVALYRDGSKRTQPLSQEKEASHNKKPVRHRLPDERKAITHKFSIAGIEGYLTVGLFENGRPGEIFLLVAKEGSTLSGIMDAFATAVSIALQYGVPLSALVKKFAYMRFEPSGLTQNKDIPIAQSVIDYIFRWLAFKFLTIEERLGLGMKISENEQTKLPNPETKSNGNNPVSMSAIKFSEDAPPCTQCGSSLMIRQAGCYYCLNCGSQGGCS